MNVVKNARILELTTEASELAKNLIQKFIIPASSVYDSIHIAVSAVNGMDYLVSWNFKHISGAKIVRFQQTPSFC